MKAERVPKSVMRRVLNFIYAFVILAVLIGVWLAPAGQSGGGYARRSAAMQESRVIGLCLYQYSLAHNGHYPEGKTSTEVFQHLIDEKYVDDPSIFYVGYMNTPEKVSPQGIRLKSENVCWDVTCCVDSSAPDGLPVVFLTGYKITYQPGSSAVPNIPLPERNWFKQWLDSGIARSFMAVAFTSSTPTWGKSISARTIEADEDGSIPNFIPADFDPKGKTCRQLTP